MIISMSFCTLIYYKTFQKQLALVPPPLKEGGPSTCLNNRNESDFFCMTLLAHNFHHVTKPSKTLREIISKESVELSLKVNKSKEVAQNCHFCVFCHFFKIAIFCFCQLFLPILLFFAISSKLPLFVFANCFVAKTRGRFFFDQNLLLCTLLTFCK